MNQEDVKRINKNIEILVRDLDTLSIAHSLLAAEILRDSDLELIQAKLTRDEKNTELLFILKRKGRRAFEAFTNALRKAGSGQEHLLELMIDDNYQATAVSTPETELNAALGHLKIVEARQQLSHHLPEQGTSIDTGIPKTNVVRNDKLHEQFFKTADQAFEELVSKYFKTDHFEYETFKNWDVVKREDDPNRRSNTIIYRCNPQPTDEPYTLFGMKTELEVSAELHFKDLLSNVELETLENSDYESVKRIAWLSEQSDVIHVVSKDFNFLCTGREILLARHWRKVNSAYVICGRSIEMDKIPPSTSKYRYYARFAAARYTPLPDNENRCIYEGLVSGDPGGWVSGAFISIYDRILGNLIINEVHLQQKKDDRINRCLRSDCNKRGAQTCLYCKHIYSFSNSVFS